MRRHIRLRRIFARPFGQYYRASRKIGILIIRLRTHCGNNGVEQGRKPIGRQNFIRDTPVRRHTLACACMLRVRTPRRGMLLRQICSSPLTLRSLVPASRLAGAAAGHEDKAGFASANAFVLRHFRLIPQRRRQPAARALRAIVCATNVTGNEKRAQRGNLDCIDDSLLKEDMGHTRGCGEGGHGK